jgi:homoserine kinase type II
MIDVFAVLANYPPDCRSTQIDALGAAGGMSGARFWRIASPRGQLVLRRWPSEFPPPDRLRFIHAVIRHAAARGCRFLPVPITTLGGQSFVGHAGYLWELAPWMPGAADFNVSPTAEKLSAAMQALAQFHAAMADFPADSASLPILAPARHLTRLRALTPAEVNGLSRAITDTTWPELAPLARQFIAALPNAISRAIAHLEPLAEIALPTQPCLRDVWHDHILFTGDDVTGLIDLGAIDIDTPATDIARLLGSLATSNLDRLQTWNDGFAAYNTLCPLSSEETAATHALDFSSPILAGYNWIRVA